MKSKKTSPEISPVMQKLADYIAGARSRTLPKPVQEKTKHHVLDTIAAMVSGSGLLPGQKGLAFARAIGGNKEAMVVGSRFVTNAINAALANGMAAHADETDDSHSASVTHAGCGVVPAALAVAERERRNGTALLRAVALGYDVGTRMNLFLGATPFAELGHLTHAFGNTFGAAAAAAALSHLNSDQVRHALSYAAQQASGVSSHARDPEHVEKAFIFGGMPARNGVTAATLVKLGCSAVEDAFSGGRNFFMAYDESLRHGKPQQPQILVRGLGKTYEIMNTTIKRWSVGAPIQAPLDSLLHLIRSENIRADDVAKVVVRVYASGARTTSGGGAMDINLQHMCALMLVDGYVTFEASHDLRRVKDPKVRALRGRIQLIADEELEKLRPSKQAIVELTLKNGKHLCHRTRAVRGAASNPMMRPEVDEKCFHLMAPILGDKRARKLCNTIWTIERIDDARKLRPLLQA